MVGKDLTASTLPEYREAWIEWLTRVFSGSPTSLVTLTFAPRLWECDSIGATGPTRSRVERAGLRFAKCLTRALASPSWFIVREFGGMNGRAHLHSLLSSADGAVIRMATEWHRESEGFVNVRWGTTSPAEYVTKYVSKSDGSWWRAGGPLFLRGVPSDRVAAVGDGDVLVARSGTSGDVRMES